MKVLVLSGGDSSERAVSIRSAASVVEALRSAGHTVVEYDPVQGMGGLEQFTGEVDAVFPILHGKGGEDGVIQARLEALGLKYLGANASVSRLCFDKSAFKATVRRLGIQVPAGETVTRETIGRSDLTNRPFVLKPNDGGSSIDTYIVRNPEIPALHYEDIFSRHAEMLLEELIDGREITVPVLGSAALPVIEIIPPPNGEFDYENKYNGRTRELCPPKSITKEQQVRAQQIAEAIHRELGIRHLSRTDIMISEDGELHVLETNTIPGLTKQSLFPKSAAAGGIGMQSLVERLLDMVLADVSAPAAP